MQQNKITILSTRPLQAAIVNKAAEQNIFIEAVSFIETEPIAGKDLKKNIAGFAKQSQTVVFTSMNAVETVVWYLDQVKPNWKIFCIGPATKKLATGYFGEEAITGIADSASALADEIISRKNIPAVLFFCGDKRRDELPEKLKMQGIEVNEIVVYKTIASSQQIKKKYDAILFYSPSAVASFFSANKIPGETILFAIGNTTAAEIKKFANNKIVISNEPLKELLAEQAISFFIKNPIHH